jgi:ribosomal protein L31E
MIGVAIYIYRVRVKWLPHFYIRKLRRREDDECFTDAYEILLKQLHRYGIERKTGQTLREYAQEIDRHFSTDEMSILTKQYELYIYGNSLKKNAWIGTKELWENLIKRTIA